MGGNVHKQGCTIACNLTHVLWGVNAIAFPSPLCALHKHGGEMYSVGCSYAAANRGNSTQLPRVDGPSPVTSGAARPSPSLARPFLPTWSSPSHPPMMGGSATLATCHALAQAHPSYSAPPLPFANKWTLFLAQLTCPICQLPVPWGCKELAADRKAALNAVVSALRHWYQWHTIH
jgi:hypothetical protein